MQKVSFSLYLLEEMVSKHISKRIGSQENFKLIKRIKITERKAEQKRIRMAVEERDRHMYLTGNIGYQIFSIKWELWTLWAKKITSLFIPAELHHLETYPYIVTKMLENRLHSPLHLSFCFLLRKLIHAGKFLILA